MRGRGRCVLKQLSDATRLPPMYIRNPRRRTHRPPHVAPNCPRALGEVGEGVHSDALCFSGTDRRDYARACTRGWAHVLYTYIARAECRTHWPHLSPLIKVILGILSLRHQRDARLFIRRHCDVHRRKYADVASRQPDAISTHRVAWACMTYKCANHAQQAQTVQVSRSGPSGFHPLPHG